MTFLSQCQHVSVLFENTAIYKNLDCEPQMYFWSSLLPFGFFSAGENTNLSRKNRMHLQANENCQYVIFICFYACPTLLDFKSCSKPPNPQERKCNNHKTAKTSLRYMGKYKTCLPFINSIPVPCYPSSSLSSFLSTVFCVFGSISLGCLA